METHGRPAVFAISGVKNSGKTTLITKLIPVFGRWGWKVAVIKHDGHHFEPDVPGTDTHCHKQAGAYATAIFSEDMMMLVKEVSVTEKELFKAFPEADLILLEGLKGSSYSKIEVIRKENVPDSTCNQEGLIAIAADGEACGRWPQVPVLDLEDAEGIAMVIREYVTGKDQRRDQMAMVLLAGGKSRRMGSSKGHMMYGGEVFWRRIGQVLAGCGPLYLSVSAEEPAAEYEEYPLIRDEYEGLGPMGGICSVMHQIPGDSFFVCACDMPLMSSAYIHRLLEQWNGIRGESWDGLMVRSSQGRIYTTAGIYHRRMLPMIEERICAGDYRMMELLRSCRIYYLEEETLGSLGEALVNVNTMEEYKRMRR